MKLVCKINWSCTLSESIRHSHVTLSLCQQTSEVVSYQRLNRTNKKNPESSSTKQGNHDAVLVREPELKENWEISCDNTHTSVSVNKARNVKYEKNVEHGKGCCCSKAICECRRFIKNNQLIKPKRINLQTDYLWQKIAGYWNKLR